MDENQDQDVRAIGWDAIDQALAPLYAGQTPKHYGTLISYALGGPDPLQGISAYKRTTPQQHWHFVTYGFSELYEKESDDPEYSGWGFELTFRLACAESDEEPPMWAVNFLQNLARYVFDSGNIFKPGDYMNANGPIALGHKTLIHAVAFALDPELSPIATPNGRVEFLQVIGITNAEELAIKRWRTLSVLEVFREVLPLWITDLARASLTENPDIQARLLAGARRDGSKTGHFFVDQLAWSEEHAGRFVVELGARQVDELTGILPCRLPHGRAFSMIGEATRIVFEPAEADVCQVSEGVLQIALSAATLDELVRTLMPKAGVYPLAGFPTLSFQIRQTQIRDNDGNVTATIG